MSTWIQIVLSHPLFARRGGELDFFDLVRWWELRRIPFNLVVGAAGVFTCLVVLGTAYVAEFLFHEPYGTQDSPIFDGFDMLLYGILANLCYTGGWSVEWLVRKIWRERSGAFGEICFAVGLMFSILLTITPALVFPSLVALRYLWADMLPLRLLQ